MNFVDTHSHIYHKQFTNDLDAMLDRCRQKGIHKIYMPNIDHESIPAMLALEEKYPDQCIAMMGLHPTSVKEDVEKELALVEEWLNKRPFVAVGEIGIDLYWDKTFLPQQQEAFRVQTQWAKDKGLPIVIHCRDAFPETLALLEELADSQLRGIFHCFTGTLEYAQRIIELGFFLGIGGVATFKNGGLDKVLPHLGLAPLVLETDSPYLAPVPYRGKRNESSYLLLVAERVAQLTGQPIEEVARITTANANTIFNGKH